MQRIEEIREIVGHSGNLNNTEEDLFDDIVSRDKKEELKGLFDQIYITNVCGEDPLKVYRDLSKTNCDADVMIVAEALAPSSVRLSGVNFFHKDGRLGNTGRSLEKFLNLFGSSVYPENDNCIYGTEIVHSFPGYISKDGKRSIRRPTREEIEKSVESGILQKEIKIIVPKIIFLMGSTSYTTFYEYFLNVPLEKSLTEEIFRISQSGQHYLYNGISVIPIQHSSGANPRFAEILKNDTLIGLIKEILN